MRAQLLAETSATSRRVRWWRPAATARRALPSTRRCSRAALEGARAHQRGLGRLLAGGEGELSQARNDGVDLERASATWSTSSFTSYHGQLLSLAVQWGVAIEIERAIKKSSRFC